MKRALALGLLVGVLLLPNVLGYQRPTVRDPGIFSYAGEQIVSGHVLYRDAWDSKGPLIFYLFALGIAIGGHSGWGVWILNWLFAASSILIGYAALRRAFGNFAAGFGAWIGLAGMFIVGGSLSTEEASLPFQFAAMYFFVRWREEENAWGYAVLIGAVAALSFLSRANNVGIHVVIALLVLYYGVAGRQWKKTVSSTLAMTLGAGLVLSIVAVYFARINALSDLIDASITYNIFYSDTKLGYRVISLVYGLQQYSPITPLLFIGVALTWLGRSATRSASPQRALIALALLDLPLEGFLSTLSGRNYSHYYVAWLPPLSIFSCALAYLLVRHREYLEGRVHQLAVRWLRWSRMVRWLDALMGLVRNPVLILQVVALLLFLNVWILRANRISLSLRANPSQAVIEYINTHTQPSDYVLMWSAEVGYNYITGRPNPSRYANQYPLYTPGYQSSAMVSELLDNLVQKRPLIIDASSTDALSPSIDDDQRKKWKPYVTKWGLLPEMDKVFAYIHAHYERVGLVGQNGWVAYKFVR